MDSYVCHTPFLSLLFSLFFFCSKTGNRWLQSTDLVTVTGFYFMCVFPPSNDEAKAMWRPVLTEHNRCFTFTPDAEGGLTSYAVTLNTDYRGKRRPRENVSHDLIHSSLRLGNEPFTLFRLHDRNENLYVLPKDDFYGEINYGSASSTEFSLSLTSVTTISRRGRECVSSARYTREECLSRCRITAVGTAHRCRLPYDTWSHLPTCNGSTYTTYPRPLGKQMASSVIIPGKGPVIPKMKDDCRASCLPACARRSFTARNAVNHLQKKKVVVS